MTILPRTVIILGLIEGVAEATSSLLKLVSGWLADRGWSSKRLVVGGYTVSNLTRPLIGLAFTWSWVLILRFSDRVGKGLRPAPRDAMISTAVDENVRGRAFGFHRAMDHAGAMIGPLLAFALLQSEVELRNVFLMSIVPGVLVLMLLIFGVPATTPSLTTQPAQRLAWGTLDHRLRGLIL